MTVYAQLRDLNHISALRTAAIGLAPAWYFLEHEQAERHAAVREGSAPDPWQYRVLPIYLLDGLQRIAPRVPQSEWFVALRVLQNWLVFLAAAAYFRRLGIDEARVLVGLAGLAWSICFANYNAGMAFDTYFDVLAYLLGATAVLAGRPAVAAAIAVVAAANRETILLLPAVIAFAAPAGTSRQHALGWAGGALAGQLIVLAALHLALGPRPVAVPEGHPIGWSMLGYNLLRPVTWLNLGTTYLFVPFVAATAWRSWPPFVRRTAALLLPIWIPVHFVAAIVAETRLFLVPWALVVLPGALSALAGATAPPR